MLSRFVHHLFSDRCLSLWVVLLLLAGSDHARAQDVSGTYGNDAKAIERVLRTPAHYTGAIGTKVSIKVRTDSGTRRLEGTLVAADDEHCTIEVDQIVSLLKAPRANNTSAEYRSVIARCVAEISEADAAIESQQHEALDKFRPEADYLPIDREGATGARQGARPVVVGRVGVDGALQGVKHALLPHRAFELQPLVPLRTVADVEAFQKWAAPQVDGPGSRIGVAPARRPRHVAGWVSTLPWPREFSSW